MRCQYPALFWRWLLQRRHSHKAMPAKATTEVPEKLAGAPTIITITGMAPDGGIDTKSNGSTLTIRNGLRWIRYGYVRTATSTTTTTGMTPTGGIRTTLTFSALATRSGFPGSRIGAIRMVPMMRSTTGIM